jgi:hypothetical protein
MMICVWWREGDVELLNEPFYPPCHVEGNINMIHQVVGQSVGISRSEGD